ncbi:uncharacterized protein LOC129189054 [Dunckerocampus dactyliophorus]|uniref:uncharacterized protein LOC129189054 n=1 Tax=Dunckerocampus dactyliophorus TaxID=161453 RepID=UPI002406C062|nr:uncharacterized protein LOC129189054 [Dunckerocampus dactyliophorus]
MRMILLLVQLATCCAVGSAINCYQCKLEVDYFSSWDWTPCSSNLNPCPAGDQCSVTQEKDQSSGKVSYKMECKADCKGDANTKCCNTDGCNKWLDVADAPAWKKLEVIKAGCSISQKDLKGCVEAISSSKTLKCYQCDLGADYFSSWDWTTKCKLTPCNAGEQCFITKDQNQVSYKMGCKAPCTDGADTKCCNSDGCNNWLDVADDGANHRTTVSTECAKTLTKCLDAIKTKTIKCYQCELGADYFTSWDWTTKCSSTLNPCPAGDQCSVTKEQNKVSYKMECKSPCTDGDDTKCCDSNGCNNWLDVADADALKKLEAIKAACSPSNKDLKGCLKAIDPTISGGGGLAGGLGLPLVLAISVIVLVVLG